MPVLKCADGKYRIGTGACIYETKAAAERAYRGYLASKYAKTEATMPDETLAKATWRETDDNWRYRVKDAKAFQSDSFRTITLPGSTVKLVVGRYKNRSAGLSPDTTHAQAYILPKADFPTKDDARAWIAKQPNMPKERTMSKACLFDATVQLLKSLEVNGDRLLFIMAADSGPDRQAKEDPATGQKWVAERIAPKFLQKMRDTANAGTLELVESHHSGMAMAKSVRTATADELKQIGFTGQYDSFIPVFKIVDGSPLGEQLWNDSQAGSLDREFSVGGSISAARVVWDPEVGGYVKEILDGTVDHLAVCRPGQAANSRANLLAAMMKALEGTDIWEKAYVEPSGEVTISAHDIDEAEEDRAEYTWNTNFDEAMTAIRLQREMPVATTLLMSVLKAILNDDQIANKQTAMKTAVDEFVVYTEQVTGVPLNKTMEDVTDEGPRAAPPVNHIANATGGRTMSTTMFKSLSDEGRGTVAQLLGTTPAGLDELSAAEVGTKLAALDEASQAAFSKAFVPLPALPAGDLTSIGNMLTQFDALAKTLQAAADKLAETLAKAEAPSVAAPPTPAPEAPLTAADVAQMVKDGIAAAAPPAELGTPPEADLGKGLSRAEVQTLIATTVKETLNKALEPVGGQPPAGELSQRDRLVALVQEKGPAGALDAIFLP